MDDPLCNVPTGATDNNQEDSAGLWRVCRQGSEKLQRLLDPEVYGGSALHTAAIDGRADAVAWLLAEGRDVNARGHGGATALHAAALTDAGTEALPLLLASGADPNAVDAFGFTSLHRAVERESLEAATLLLSSGANVTLPAPGRETPLHLAAYANARDLAQLLLGFGADPFARNGRGVAGFEVGLFDLSAPPFHMS
ncbi:hypothetical protein P43SY_004806 [Pythium insidiosum]|uniref:Ankyrin repeat domain-containing protein n=1 Tax=Pythium insidiosum TaxID=114742 RepID=A0AAD5Q6N4_PYTIN|nr:hypothetical protein P43SY_004806 [Pythium insidiosum]